MIKKIILSFSLLAGITTFAQQGTASPYSAFGVGDVKFKGTHEVKSMGGLAIYQDSLHVNTLNPASYAKLQSTAFTIGFTNTSTNIASQNSSSKATRNSFDYFALAFPAGKFGMAFGIMPYSFVGYNIQNKAQENEFTVSRQYLGDGGINRAFFGIGYEVNKQLNIGAEFAYNFGDTELSNTKFIIDDGTGFAIDRGSRKLLRNNYSGMTVNTSVNYTQPLQDKIKLQIGATFSPQSSLKNNQEVNIATVNASNGSVIDEESSTNYENKLVFPMKYSVGTGIGDPNKWFVGVEYTATQNSKLNNHLQTATSSFSNGHKVSFGGFYTPHHISFTNYLSRVTYRAGGKYEKTGLAINNQEVNDFSVNIGVGLPISRNISNLNIGLEYGQRGTKSAGLIRENYFNLSIGLSFNDKWFTKRRFE